MYFNTGLGAESEQVHENDTVKWDQEFFITLEIGLYLAMLSCYYFRYCVALRAVMPFKKKLVLNNTFLILSHCGFEIDRFTKAV